MSADPRERLASLAHGFYSRGWMLGTSGNVSLRDQEDRFWISASGRYKGGLGPADFLAVDLEGRLLPGAAPGDRPSAETCIHAAIYALFPATRAVFHVHTVHAAVAARLAGTAEALRLPPLEMLKGLGRWEPDPQVEVAVFPNHSEVPKVAAEIRARFAARPPDVPGLLILDHGLTAWGPSAEAARDAVELFEFLLHALIVGRSAGLGW